MSHKTRALYDAVFLQVKAMLPDTVQPEYLLTDYETALQKGLGTIFPEATVLGCWFHFSQVRVNKFTYCDNMGGAEKPGYSKYGKSS